MGVARPRLTRRMFLRRAATGAAVLGSPVPLRGEPPTFTVGVIHPVTGLLAEAGRACRLGAQLAVDAINAAGGVRSLDGMKLELLLGDTQTTPDVDRRDGIGRPAKARAVSRGHRRGRFDHRERRQVGDRWAGESPVRLSELPD